MQRFWDKYVCMNGLCFSLITQRNFSIVFFLKRAIILLHISYVLKRMIQCCTRLLRCICLFFRFVDICEALNVTVSPGPRTWHVVGDNVTLFCHVSQKRRRENLLAVRWIFALPSAQEYLMIKMTKYGVVQYYGNYTSHSYKRRLRLLEEKHRTMYTFLILNIQQAEQGHYICKVQEIGKQRNKWTSWSNGSASTEVQGEKITGGVFFPSLCRIVV